LIEYIILVWLHFIGDFILQSDEVAKTKSSNNKVLLKHVLLYAIPLLMFGPLFASVNAGLHFIVDWVTSRLTSHYYKTGERHKFFVTIGADQALHLTCLFITLKLLGV
jgi:hypothetical protein